MNINIYVLDIFKKVIATLNTSGVETPIFNDIYKQYLSTGAETFTFSIKLTDDIASILIEGNYVIFKWHDKLKLFQIENCKDEENVNSVHREVYCTISSLELYQTHIRPTIIEGNVKTFLTTILQDTNYNVGYISPKLDNIIETIEITQITPVYTAIQNAISVYHNIEIEFRTECINSIHGKYEFYVDVYADGERGTKTYKRFEYDYNTYGTKREGDSSQYYSGLIAEGVNGITFSDIEWLVDNGDPLDKPIGQDFLVDPEVHEVYNNGGKYILGSYKSNTAKTNIDLLWETYYKLQEVKQIKYNYTIPVYITEEEYSEIDIGDTVCAVNPKFNPPLELEARIGELEISFTDRGANTLTLSNYKVVKSKINKYSNDDIINEAISTILNLRVGKLTEGDKIAIRELLNKLNMQGDAVDKIINDIQNKLTPDIPELPLDVGEDLENYDIIKIDNTDGGLWVGDKRIADIYNYGLANIDTSEASDNEDTTKEYAEAVAYYANFDLGKNKSNSVLASISSTSNKYKIYVMVNYWCKKFGLDPQMVYMLIMAESTGDPYCATSYSGGGYGLLQCERDAYFGIKQTIKFLDGTTKSFTPSYSTMKPGNGGNTTINGVVVDKNINNQIMFGCYELRYNLELWHYNIFATLIGYNMGVGAMGWILNKYVCDTYGYTFNGGRVIANLPSNIKNKCYEVLDTYKAPFAPYRKQWQDNGGKGTLRNIELYLRYYNPVNNNLPYALDKNGNKIGYGVSTPASNKPTKNTGSSIRQSIVDTIEAIVQQHKRKEATYDQSYRTWNFKKPKRRSGTFYGCKNPICYDCSSAVTCCYTEAGLKSIVGANNYCYMGTLVAHATAKPGYMMWKVDAEGIKKALPGDIVMDANFKVNSDNLNRATMIKEGATHHTMIYRGEIDGKPMVSHASKWAYPYDAIKTSALSYYQNKGTAFFLRPYDLVEADKLVSSEEATGSEDEIVVEDTIIQSSDLNSITIKALEGATASNFIDDRGDLVQSIEVGDKINNIVWPLTTKYIFIHLGIPELDVNATINLIKALKVKYIKTPIFVIREWHVTSLYGDNYEEINTNIDNYNTAIHAFCNTEDYVIYIDDSTLDTLLSISTEDGYSLKNKTSVENYFSLIKTNIQNIILGGVEKDTDTDIIKGEEIELVLKNGETKTLNILDKLTMKCPSKVVDDFYSKIIFTTNKNTDPLKFYQSTILYLEGKDCKLGALIPNADIKYTITVMANSDLTQYNGKKYYGYVTGISNGGKYKDFSNFVGADMLINIADSYYNNRTSFQYENDTPLSYSNPEANKSKWYINGLYNIDCSTFVGLCLRGLYYNKSPYVVATNEININILCAWAIAVPRTAADIAKFCVSNGWILYEVDTTNWSNLEKGDIIFWDRDNKDNNRFMSISHVAFVYGFDTNGDVITIEVTTLTGTVIKRKLINNHPDEVVLVARIRKE